MRRLERPRMREGVVERARVFRALDRGWDASLTLVVAPAGYGKTVAVDSWLASRGHPAAWVTLDERDNDAVRLWSEVAAAAERAFGGPGARALERLRDPLPTVEPGIDELAAELAADGRALALVLDDLQLVEDEACLRLLDYALATLPWNVHLIALSRAVPRLRLARLRSQRQLVELRASELAFTAAEAGELFAAVDDAALDEATVAALTQRTEGWAAALYLSALWLGEHGDPSAGLGTFRGSHGHIAEYLAGEVLRGLDEPTRDFLLRSSAFASMSGELCDAVLATHGSAGRLAALERSNLLVVAFTDRPGWYRYHALLREYLATELDALEPGAAAALRDGALAWSRAQGLVEDAAVYAHAGADWPALAALVEDHNVELLRNGRARTLARWTSWIPRGFQLERPPVLIAAIYAAHAVAEPTADVRRLVTLAHTAWTSDTERWTQSDVIGLHLAIATYVVDHAGEALAAADLAARLAREHVEELLVVALATLAMAELHVGRDTRAVTLASEALAHPDAAQRPYGFVIASAVLALVAARAGRRETARAHADDALAACLRAGFTAGPSTSRAELADAVAAALEGRLVHAERAAQRAARNTYAGGVAQAWALCELAGIELRRGRFVAAARSLAHADELVTAARDPGALPALAASIHMALKEGRAGATTPPAELPSRAELAVLRLLPGCTVREIADALYLSPNTIKSHIRAIYRKLDVNTREDALARAVALGLLDDPNHPGETPPPS